MKELEEYAKINNIPIMQKDGILYLINYIVILFINVLNSILMRIYL